LIKAEIEEQFEQKLAEKNQDQKALYQEKILSRLMDLCGLSNNPQMFNRTLKDFSTNDGLEEAQDKESQSGL